MSQHKNVLFIAPQFAGYENEIIEAIQNKGYKVDFFAEKLYTFKYNLYKKFNIKHYLKLEDIYLDSIIQFAKGRQYDFLILIRGEIISQNFLDTLFRNAIIKKKILYQWDSIENIPRVKTIIKYFDNVFSFDRNDCEKYKLNYLSLFYMQKYIRNDVRNEYDILFIGSDHSERIKYIKQFKEISIQRNYKFKIILYMSFYSFLTKFLFDKNYKFLSFDDIILKKISIKEAYTEIKKAKVIIDLPYSNQCGQTMRTIETLSCDKKLITTNQCIKGESFYLSSYIKLIEDPLDNDFFNDSNQKNNIQDLEINNWINILMEK